jgi:LysM repeat protein
LIQGCNSKKDASTPQLANLQDQTITNELPPLDTNTLVAPPVDTNPAAVQPIATPQGYVMPPGATNVIPIPTPLITPPVATTETKEYKVAKNDSLYTIAKAHGIPVSAMVKANPNVDPKKLQPGQMVLVPAAVSSAADTGTAATANALTTYVVKPNDTLTRVARQHNLTLKALRAANKNLKTDRLIVGQKLKIPAASAAPAAPGVPAVLSPEPAPAGNPPVISLPVSGNPQ